MRLSDEHDFPVPPLALPDPRHLPPLADLAQCDSIALFIQRATAVNPADTPRHRGWVQDYWSALHPHSAGGAYVNFLMDEGQDQAQATYRDNYDRLAAIKAKNDPANLFRVNQNITPAADPH